MSSSDSDARFSTSELWTYVVVQVAAPVVIETVAHGASHVSYELALGHFVLHVRTG